MNDLIIYIIIAVVCFYIGWRARESYAKLIVSKYLDNMQESIGDDSSILSIEVEKHANTYYVYNIDTNSFITQVNSKEQLFEYFKVNHPDKTVIMKNEHFALFETT
jgi:hypothetical protein